MFLVTQMTGRGDRRGEGPSSYTPQGCCVDVASRPAAGLGHTSTLLCWKSVPTFLAVLWRVVAAHSRTWGRGSRSTSGGGGRGAPMWRVSSLRPRGFLFAPLLFDGLFVSPWTPGRLCYTLGQNSIQNGFVSRLIQLWAAGGLWLLLDPFCQTARHGGFVGGIEPLTLWHRKIPQAPGVCALPPPRIGRFPKAPQAPFTGGGVRGGGLGAGCSWLSGCRGVSGLSADGVRAHPQASLCGASVSGRR